MKHCILWRAAVMAMTLALAQSTLAQSAGAVHKQVEASLQVAGSITIATDGSVEAVDLDAPEKLPKGIAAFVGSNVAAWRFEPVIVDGQPRRAQTRMSALLVGKPVGDGQFRVSIRGADFGDAKAGPESERVAGRRMTPPGYPQESVQGGAQGTVYLLLRIERDGTVGDVFTEQVNLRMAMAEPLMNRHRERFARTAMAVARTWTFATPTTGELAAQPHWVVRVPVDFTFSGERRRDQWSVYVPGPRARPVWAPGEDAPGFSPDALADGGIHLANERRGPRLLTPLDDA